MRIRYFIRLCICGFCLQGCVQDKLVHTTDWYLANREIYGHYRSLVYARLLPHFKRAKLAYPPHRFSLLTFKAERKIELWAQNQSRWRRIKVYPLMAYSGHFGPKLQSRDGQIPEGIYRVEFLYPFSHYHLGMRLNYPNEYDKYHAKLEHRRDLGGDIYIHGKNKSVGCLALGDEAIEELYVLAYEVGVKNISVIIAPNDLRYQAPLNLIVPHPAWTSDLDHRIWRALQPYH